MRDTNMILAKRKREMGQLEATEIKEIEKSKLNQIAKESERIDFI